MKHLALIIILAFMLAGCRKDEKLITGDITGSITLYEHTYNSFPPQSGIKVKLLRDSKLVDSTLTDNSGYYIFNNLPYGRYDLACSWQGFVRPRHQSSVFHVGGFSPTLYDYELYEIPAYQLQLNNVGYYAEDDLLTIPLEVDGDTILPGNSWSYFFRAFMSNSPDVSKDNYTAIAKGIIGDWGLNYLGTRATYGRIVTYEIQGFDNIKALPVFMVLYPIANNQGYYPEDFFPEALGPASNVISFNWAEISQGK